MDLRPVALIASVGNLTARIACTGVPAARDSRVLEHIDGWEIRSAQSSSSAPSLWLCPNPPPGVAKVQAYEQTTYDVWIEGDSINGIELHLDDQDRTREAKVGNGSLYWSLNWGNYVGASVVRIVYDERELCLPVEVRSRKVDYLDDYRAMLDDVSERLAALIFDYGSPTAVYAQRAAFDRHIAYIDYLFVRYLMAERRLPLHFRIVAADPHRAMDRETVWADLARARSFTPRSLQAMYAYSQHLVRPQQTVAPVLQRRLGGYIPTQLLDDRVVTTFDTPPNRFIKHFLTQLVRKLRELESVFGLYAQSTHLAADCRRWRGSVEHLSRAHFMEDVGDMHLYPAGSQVLLKREGYRQINDYYRRFLLTGKAMWEGFDEDLVRTPSKDMATLYEYWCFFQLLDAVAAALGTQIDPRQFIVEEGGVFKVTINQSGKSQGKIGQATVHYNRYYGRSKDGSYSVTLHPDYAVELPGGRLVILDAKYKYQDPNRFMSTGTDPSADEEQDEERLMFVKGDLYKMHTYRDALRAQAVFVLYPGTEFRAFGVDGKRYDNLDALGLDFAGVGAVALRPGQTEMLGSLIRALVRQ